MKQVTINFHRVNSDVNGNPRFVCHFLNLNTRQELDADPWITLPSKYDLALARARKVGGRKFHNKQFGGGIVFQSYSLAELQTAIERVTGREYPAE